MTVEPEKTTTQSVGVTAVGLSAADYAARLLVAEKGRDTNAIAALVIEAVSAHPLDTSLLSQAESTMFKIGLKDKAEIIAAHAVEHGVADGDLMVQHANGLWRKGDAEGAEHHYRAAISAEPKNARAYFRLACMYRDQKRFAEAAPIAARATEYEPAVGLYWRLRSNLCEDLGDLRGADAHRRAANRIKNSIRNGRSNG